MISSHPDHSFLNNSWTVCIVMIACNFTNRAAVPTVMFACITVGLSPDFVTKLNMNSSSDTDTIWNILCWRGNKVSKNFISSLSLCRQAMTITKSDVYSTVKIEVKLSIRKTAKSDGNTVNSNVEPFIHPYNLQSQQTLSKHSYFLWSPSFVYLFLFHWKT